MSEYDQVLHEDETTVRIFVLFICMYLCEYVHITRLSINYSKHSYFSIESNARKFETV